MRHLITLILVLLVLLVLGSACGAPATPAPAQPTTAAAQPTQAPAAGPPTELVLSVWGGPHQGIIQPNLAKFEKENNAKVVFMINTTGDRVTKLYAEKGSPTIDVALVPIDEVPGLLANDAILPANEKVPNYDKLMPEARVKGGYGVSRMLVVLGFNTNTVKEKPTSWLDIGKEQFKGHISMPKPPGAPAYALLSILAKIGGGSESNLEPAFTYLKQWKPYKAFIDSWPASQPMITAGDLWVFANFTGVMLQFQDTGGPVDFVIPKEGGVLAMNVAVIPKGVKNLALTEKLVGALLSEDVQTAYAKQLYYSPSVTGIKLDSALDAKIYPHATDKVNAMDIDALTKQKEKILERFAKEIQQ